MNKAMKYTNISIKQICELDGFQIRPCMKSGFCCTKSPCAYGQWNDDKSACKYLATKNDIGQRDCLRYQWIIENVPTFEIHPAFHTGCSSAIGNVARNSIIERVKDMQNSEMDSAER